MVKMDFNNYFYIFRKSLNYTFLFFKFKNKTNKYFEKQSLLTCAKLNLEHTRLLKCSNSIYIDGIRHFEEILKKMMTMKKLPKFFL